MKVNSKFNAYINKYFLIILLLKFFMTSKSIQTGKYPYIKRLINGNYIIVSSTGIIISDKNLSDIIAHYDFNSPVYDGQDSIGSTSIAQFTSINNGYILASARDKLYVLSSTGDCLAHTNISFVFEKFPCSLIPHSNSGQQYYFSLIYGEINDKYSDELQNLVIKKGIFDSGNNNIIFEENKYFDFSNITNSKIKATISCDLMKKENKEYITCLFGNYNDLICAVFDPNSDYKIIQYQKSDMGGLYFKSVVLPEEKQKSIFCSFKSGNLFKCINYDISTNNLTNIQTIRERGCKDRPTSLMMEYFQETDEFLIGCYGDTTQIYLTSYNSNLERNNISYNFEDAFGENYGNLGRVNLIFSNQNSYNFFFYPNPECNCNCPTSSISMAFQEDIGTNNKNDYSTIETTELTISTTEPYKSTSELTTLETEPTTYIIETTELTISTTELEITTSEPTVPETEPTDFIIEQTSFTDEPIISITEPTTSTTEFTVSSTEPFSPITQPSTSEIEFASSTTEFNDSITEQTTSAKEQSNSTTNPTLTNEPTISTNMPVTFTSYELKEENTSSKAVFIENKIDNLISDFKIQITNKSFSCEESYMEENNNKDYNIIIYKNNNKCQEEQIPKELTIIEFPECYEKIKEENNIDKKEELIVSKVELMKNKNSDISEKVSVYSFYHPTTGEKLNSSSCENKTIILKEDFSKKFESIEYKKEEFIIKLIKQGINILNPSDRFYNDLCFSYKSPNGRDVPLKARLSSFFPNITLCESGCKIVGVDLNVMRAKCECQFKNLVDIDNLGDNLYSKAIKDVFEVLSQLNIEVVKCFKDIFVLKKFSKCTGGYIILSLFLGQIICHIKFAKDGLFFIRKYFFKLINSYLNYKRIQMKEQNFETFLINTPPIKNKKKKSKKGNIVGKNICLNISKKSHENYHGSNNNLIESIVKKNLFLNKGKNKPKTSIFLINNKIKNVTNKKYTMININNKGLNKNNNKLKTNEKEKDIDMKEFLSLSFDENNYDDVIEKDKRKFCTYFGQKYIEGQIFINTFYIKEPLRPMEIKCLILIIIIESYFTITALFYNEDYLTDLFYSSERDLFFSFIKRRYNDFFYTFFISGIIYYLLDFFFIEEKKIKKIFNKNKNSELKIKNEIAKILQEIKIRFTILIFLSIFLTIIIYIYISCFNNVYPYIKTEWIKSSLFIFIVAQFINFSILLIQSILRYISINCKNEKLFKLSKVF